MNTPPRQFHPSVRIMRRRGFRNYQRHSAGSVLIVAMVICMVISLALASYLSLANTAAKISQRSFLANDSMNVSEAALEQALWSFNQTNAGNTAAWNSPNAWTISGDNARCTMSGFTLAQNATGSARVYVQNYNSTGFPVPVMVSLSTILPASGPEIKKMIYIELTRRSFFSTGMVAKNGVTFSGNNATVDSWNSDPDNNSATAAVAYSTSVRQAHGSVATTNVSSTVSVQNADIFGYVSVASSSSGAISVGSQGKVTGDFGATGYVRDDSRIATNFTADLPDITVPTTYLNSSNVATSIPWITYKQGADYFISGAGNCQLPDTSDINGNKGVTVGGVTTFYYTAQYIQMAGNSSNKLTIKPGYNVVIQCTSSNSGKAVSTSGSGGVEISTGATLNIYTAGNVDITGDSSGNGGLLNNGGQPKNFMIWGTSTAISSAQTISIAGNGNLSAAVYAPNADINIVGNGAVYGAVVGKTIDVKGDAAFHYDESLANFGGSNPFKISKWKELVSKDARATWATDGWQTGDTASKPLDF